MARIDRSLLSFLGILIAHEAAYLTSSIAGYGTSVAHGHLKTAWLLGTVAVLGLLTRSVVGSLRRRNHQPASPAQLSAFIAGGYFLVEQAERFADGYSALTLFTEPVFWLGIAIAPLVAALLTRSLESIEAVSARLFARPTRPQLAAATPSSLGITALAPVATILLSSCVSRRGPPVGLSLR